ncbi:MAG: carbon monoxide dehydrogenase beta subunit family protein [Nitrospirota bacterium]
MQDARRMPTYRVLPGPEAFLPPAAAMLGVMTPDEGEVLVEGRPVPVAEGMEIAARRLLEAKNPTIFPGPLVLWRWCDRAAEEATAVKELAEAIPAHVIPMADYRPKYPKIHPDREINPNHPNLTIWYNRIDVCVFVGVHCHQANIALKIIRGGTNCYTIALCTFHGDEEANLTIRDLTASTIRQLADTVKRLKVSPTKRSKSQPGSRS